MYRQNGQSVFVVDTHVHFWDASPANTLNRNGEGWIECFYNFHAALSPPEFVWPVELYRKYPEEQMMKDLFEEGYVDVAIFMPTYLKDFFRDGFNTLEQDAVMKQKHPDKFILNGSFDPRLEEEGLKRFEEEVREHGLKGLKLYTAEWRGDSKGWKLGDPWARRYLDKCVELGVTNIHVHKGPTIWPLNMDAFDVKDIDEVASLYRDDLKFIVEHCGLPRLDDFCWIAAQEPNVYAGLSVVMPFINGRPRFFAETLAALLWWLGPDRLLFSSDYAIWSPKWIVEKFMAFDFPDDVKEQWGVALTPEVRAKILGLNAAALYDIPVPVSA